MLAMARILCFLTMVATAAAQCMNGECSTETDVGESSLLQIEPSQRKIQKHGRSEPKIYIEMDGENNIPAPRREMTGFVREVLFKYPLASNPITVTGKTARIEMGKVLESLFSRDAYTPPEDGAIRTASPELTNPEEQRDFGVQRAVAFVGKKSLISDKVKFAFAEKSHTLYIPDEVSHASENRLKSIMRRQSFFAKSSARFSRTLRNTALSAFATTAGSQIILAGQDLNLVAAIRNLSRADGGKPDASFSQAMKRANHQLKHRESRRTRKTPVRSSIGCLHFENAELMNFTDEAVEVPLDTKIVGYRGRVASTPNKEYQMSSGIAIFHHNVKTNTLDIFFGFSSVIDVADSANGYGSIFSVGPADGASMPVVPEGRSDISSSGGLGATSWNTAKKMPVDFSFMHSRRQDVGCPDEVLLGLSTQVEKVQDMLASEEDMGKAMSSMGSVASLVQTLNQEVNCAVEFIKPWDKDQVASFGRLEAVGLIHVLMEMPGKTMQVGFNSSKLWNTITVL